MRAWTRRAALGPCPPVSGAGPGRWRPACGTERPRTAGRNRPASVPMCGRAWPGAWALAPFSASRVSAERRDWCSVAPPCAAAGPASSSRPAVPTPPAGRPVLSRMFQRNRPPIQQGIRFVPAAGREHAPAHRKRAAQDDQSERPPAPSMSLGPAAAAAADLTAQSSNPDRRHGGSPVAGYSPSGPWCSAAVERAATGTRQRPIALGGHDRTLPRLAMMSPSGSPRHPAGFSRAGASDLDLAPIIRLACRLPLVSFRPCCSEPRS